MNLDFLSRSVLDGAHSYERACHNGYVCADCVYAQMFAVQPRAFCRHPEAALAGQVLFAGQPACRSFAIRHAEAVALSAFDAAQHAAEGAAMHDDPIVHAA